MTAAPGAPTEESSPTPPPQVSASRQVLVEQRDFFLRSLQDLDAEWAVGDLDESDYHALKDEYTARAAAVLRRIEAVDEPGPEPTFGPAAANEAPGRRARRRWPSRSRSPRKLAAGVGVVAVVALVAGWAVVHSSGTRAPGEVISGQAVGDEATAQLLVDARQAVDKQNAVGALKDYQKILKVQPDNVEALTDEGWLLAQTQQANLLGRSLALFEQAEAAAPGYAPAHLYRGIVLLDQGHDAAAVPELRFYLANHPDPQLVAGVRQALTQATSAAGG